MLTHLSLFNGDRGDRKGEQTMKKFELTTEAKIVFGRTLYRIKALIAFSDVEAGDLGGWVAKEENLSHDGDAWVYSDARVYGNAEVYGDAMVYGNAEVSGNAWVYGNARVSGNAWVYGNAWVSGDAEVSGDARVSGNADLLWISKLGSRNGTTTFFKAKVGIEVSCGCFFGTMAEFEAKVQETHGDNEHGKAYKLAIELAKLRLGEADHD